MLNKISHRKTLTGLSYVGLTGCSAVFLFTLAAMLFAPAVAQQRAAAIEGGSDTSTYSVTPTVGISLPASIDFADVLPTPSGATTTATADLTITTSDSAGYSLYLYSSDGDNSLKPKISSLANISTINATAGDVGLTLSSLKPNTWGYNLGTEAPTDTTTYSAVPTDNSIPIQTKDTSTTNSANDTYTLSFGAKVDTTTASGAYSNTLTIAVVAEPKKVSTWDDLTVMQDMSSEICDSASIGATKRLTDSRDGKQYWVAKLPDGNCWMTQNLDLDLSTNVALTPDDSDVKSNWVPTVSTEATGTITSNASDIGLYSWDLGMYVKSNPSNYSNYCGGSNIQELSDSNCTAAGWKDVSTMIAMEESRTDNVVTSDNTYDAHYLAGNLYQWNAATASTGNSITDQNSPSSICPKGWRLPTSNSSSNGDFIALTNGLTSNTITQAPYYFLPVGDISSGAIYYAGSNGCYWSSTAHPDSSYAYVLGFYSNYVNPSNHGYRSRGYSVRCVAR